MDRKRLAALSRLWRLMREVDPRITVVLVLAESAVGLFPVASVYALRRLIDVAQQVAGGAAPLAAGLAWGAVFAALQLLPSLFNLTVGVLRDGFQERLRGAIEERCYRQAQALPLETLELPEHHDRLERVRQGTEQRLFSTLHFLWRNLSDVVALVSLLVYLGQFHWALPLLLAAGSSPGAWLQQRVQRERYLLERRQTDDQRRWSAYERLLTGRDAAAEIRLFGFGPWLIDRTIRLWRTLQDERLHLGAHEARQTALFEALNGLAYLAAMVFSVALLFAGRASVGAYAALFSAVESFQFGYQRLLWETFLVYEDLRYVEDFFDFVDQPAPPLDSGGRLPSPLRQGIVFENVSFTYPGATQPALASVSFTLRPGERIALVGENGAGKSTLVKLLMGLYRPSAGRILVDGTDLRDLALDGWYARLGAVFQQFNRYQATVRENVGFGWIAALDDVARIEAAMRRSGADAVAAALPAGINTPLGKEFWDGAELSAGQWQKLAIARAYFRPAELLVLDEPASALDAQAEADVYEHFARLATASTVILISHRLGSCRIAQRILVLQDGRLCEEGTHAELLAAGGVYADLYRLQAAWYR